MRSLLNHFASPQFWLRYHSLPEHIQSLADECYKLLKSNPRYPSLHLKKIGSYWSVRVGVHYRAVGIDAPSSGILWFWIGSHSEYDRLIG
jgi:hypothetical protein